MRTVIWKIKMQFKISQEEHCMQQVVTIAKAPRSDMTWSVISDKHHSAWVQDERQSHQWAIKFTMFCFASFWLELSSGKLSEWMNRLFMVCFVFLDLDDLGCNTWEGEQDAGTHLPESNFLFQHSLSWVNLSKFLNFFLPHFLICNNRGASKYVKIFSAQ